MGNTCLEGLMGPAEPDPRTLRLEIGYWDFRGLGAPMRMMCSYSGAGYEDKMFSVKKKPKGGWTASEWDRVKRPKLSETNPLVQLPYVLNLSTGDVVSQSNAVYLYLGRILGLSGKTDEEKRANEQVLFYLHTMWMEMRDLVYPGNANKDDEAFRESLKHHFDRALPAHYEKLDGWLKLRQAAFFVASVGPCTADFHAWEMLDQQEAMALSHGFGSPVSDFDLLQDFYSRFRKLRRMQTYFQGDASRLPINNKMAFFK